MKCKPRGSYTLSVENLDAGDLILREGGDKELIKLLCGDREGSSLDLTLSDYTTHFHISLDASAVVGYKKQLDQISEEKAYTDVSFQLQLSHEGVKGKLSDTITIRVKIEDPKLKLAFRFELDREPITYDAEVTDKQSVGSLVINHTMQLACAPEMAVSFTLRVESEGSPYEQFIMLDFEALKESNPIKAGGEVVIDGVSTSVLRRSTEIRANRPTLFKLGRIKSNDPTNEISIPLLLDMTKIVNPGEDEQAFKLTLEADCFGKLFGEDILQNEVLTQTVTVHKNRQLNELKVMCCNGAMDHENELVDGVYDWGRKLLSPNMTNKCVIRLRNAAAATDTAHPNASVIIRHLRQTRLDCDTKRVVLKGNKKPEAYFRLTDANLVAIDTLEENTYHLYPMQTNRGAELELHLAIESNAVREIRRDANGSFSSPMSISFAFDYIISLSGELPADESAWEHYDGSIRWVMEQVPNPEWLSVDFGTSAIVASYAKNFSVDKDPLLDLKQNKDVLLRRTHKGHLRQKDETLEPNPFIPSVISLNSVDNEGDFDKRRSDAEFKEYPIWLSPSTGMMDIMLPCLKTLIGYKTLPNILSEGERIRFKYKVDGNEVLLFDEEGEAVECGLAYVNTILEEVYKQLFQHYICLEHEENPIDAKRLHKVVLSVPNTFTPKHHALLKNIAKKNFPNLRPEYLQVVSESDAVACYYLAKRNEFFENARFLDEERKSKLSENERVLVFDMGAGTLDLTYFIKKVTPDGRTFIDMQGKIGLNKAGNYLDYLLGEILCDLLETKVKDVKPKDVQRFRQWLETDKAQREKNVTDKKECESLKNFLKDKIKPFLNNREMEIPAHDTFEFVSAEGSLCMKDICQHPKYKAYIKECTEEVLDNLQALLRTEDTGSMMGYRNASLPIDVLVFSGRSTALLDIRQAVARHINRNADSDEVLCADLTTTSLIRLKDVLTGNHQNDDPNNGISLKTVVTFGSLIYADWINRPTLFHFTGKKVFADYGLLIRHVNKGWEWYPLITSQTPELPSSANRYAAQVMFSNSLIYSMEQAQEIIFAQSYSRDPASDWRDGRKDMITEMAYFNVPDGAHGNQPISMTIDANNTITCFIDGFGQISLEPHDDFQNESLRKSLWPVVF
ncbi:hypothetical protein M2480_000570 [Parabacteroides sp. PFB2-12]|uniref:hypothetical protein n=1 Tax=unclassified Parabacteroides TaxID=2649774 RepID=UPI002476C2EF|nr:MULTISPECIES: hypothetical protein [unclassified Parabacteroides]MDH6341907.1 hypothetical protein [Parabacteroides sp. PM6-13]MDH6389605.1 hypothetical protein [Parabacteroides sp. PFB2-12]